MTTVANCLRQHAPAYLAKFGESVPWGHRKVLWAITRCRTGELGGLLYRCDGCGRKHWVGRSCGNRHCPCCGLSKTDRWLEKQAARLLPVHHFLVTFTVGDQLRWLLRRHPREGYAALFAAGSETIAALAARSKYLAGCQLGFFGVLHTWGRDPTVYHPHVHFIVPGGGASADRSAWRQTPQNFLFPHAAAVTIYKAKLADELRQRGLYDAVAAAAWEGKFVVDMRPVGDGQAVLKYLAPYVNRVAISDHRIVSCEQFVRGFLQHTLPRGFQKIRYYGWMSPNHRIGLEEMKWLVWLFLRWVFWFGSGHAPPEKGAQARVACCTKCGGTMRLVAISHPPCRALLEHALAYLDSG